MKALKLTGIRELQLLDLPEPGIEKPTDVLVRIRASGICGSDLHGYTGQSGRRVPPLTMGHEASGEVVRLGSEVKRLRVGDRVALQPWTYCGTCPACLDGRHLWCPHRSLLGMNAPGAFAEYLVCPAVNLYPLPETVSFEQATMTEPVAVALHAVGRAHFKPYETVVIIGAGTIGLLVLAVVRLMGLRQLLVIDVDDDRLKMAESLGADAVINAASQDSLEAVQTAVAGEGVDHAFEVVGIPATFHDSIRLARRGGEVIWIGNNERLASLDVQSVVTREISIQPSYAFTLAEFGRALELLASGKMPVDRFITRRASLDEGPKLFEELLANPKTIKCVFRLTPESEPVRVVRPEQ